MLLLIGTIGLLATIGMCRKPGVKYFTIFTVFNRKEKLTEKGATLYLVFLAIALVGIAISFASKS